MRPTLSHTVHQHLIVALKSYRHMLRKRQFATPSHRTTLLSVNVFVLASVECIYSLRATPPDQNYRSKGPLWEQHRVGFLVLISRVECISTRWPKKNVNLASIKFALAAARRANWPTSKRKFAFVLRRSRFNPPIAVSAVNSTPSNGLHSFECNSSLSRLLWDSPISYVWA